jgi:predicted amino acid racemase
LGGTAVFDLLDEGSDRGGITQLRIGEALFFGYNMSAGKALPGFERDAFAFYGEIIEVKEKDVSFSGSFGFNAFGTRVPLNGSGRRIRAVLDFGELAAPISCLKPAAEGVSLVGSTHDFAVADITECGRRPRVGDVLEFATNYTGASCAMLNPSVRKTIL